MKFLSFLCLLGVINAIYWGIKNQWMFDPTKQGGSWWVANAAVGVGCLVLGPILWNIAQVRSHNRVASTLYRYGQGEASEEEVRERLAEHDRDLR